MHAKTLYHSITLLDVHCTYSPVVAEDDPNEGHTDGMVHTTPVRQKYFVELESSPLPARQLSGGCGQLLRFLECDSAEQPAVVSFHWDLALPRPQALHHGAALGCLQQPPLFRCPQSDL
ncbi:hypothetical protein T11_11671 [Trichinella zimbabwensis]|uniref:Uncharacterized protein n=1 Tax=Trichinella zimbabwensis TaxID=268475 RepID=A0A0V1HQM5_9BILA|nr:hypothetical protein T11_11671 [Trichinella zimbabwensis]